jgi:hypothetical protein
MHSLRGADIIPEETISSSMLASAKLVCRDGLLLPALLVDPIWIIY